MRDPLRTRSAATLRRKVNSGCLAVAVLVGEAGRLSLDFVGEVGDMGGDGASSHVMVLSARGEEPFGSDFRRRSACAGSCNGASFVCGDEGGLDEEPVGEDFGDGGAGSAAKPANFRLSSRFKGLVGDFPTVCRINSFAVMSSFSLLLVCRSNSRGVIRSSSLDGLLAMAKAQAFAPSASARGATRPQKHANLEKFEHLVTEFPRGHM